MHPVPRSTVLFGRGRAAVIAFAIVVVTGCSEAQDATDSRLRPANPRPGTLEADRLARWRQTRFSYVGDDQRLALIDKGTRALRYGPYAAISPSDELSRLTMANFASRIPKGDTIGVLVAQIDYDLKRGPNVGVYEKLQIRPGRNALYLRYDGKVGDVRQEQDPKFWRAFVVWERNPRDVRRIAFNRRESHAGQRVLPPATARFVWRDDDEWGWVMCAAGCCEVGGGGF
jgi:hypothetical protein